MCTSCVSGTVDGTPMTWGEVERRSPRRAYGAELHPGRRNCVVPIAPEGADDQA